MHRVRDLRQEVPVRGTRRPALHSSHLTCSQAINIINLPKSLEKEQTHRYGPNSFKLHRLPMPRPGQVLGLVGTNGIGKSTALKILAGKQKPNLGRFENPPDWQEILVNFRGSELQNYFTKILEDNLKAIIKPQYVDHIPKAVKGRVGEIMASKNQRDNVAWAMSELDLDHVSDRDVEVLSGGELQRFAIAVVVIQQADVYMFDEPSSYLDVKQRLKVPPPHRVNALANLPSLGGADDQVAGVERARAGQVRAGRGARPGHPGLPVRLHLLHLRHALRVRSGDDAVLGARGHQRVPRRLHTHREPALQRRGAQLQDGH